MAQLEGSRWRLILSEQRFVVLLGALLLLFIATPVVDVLGPALPDRLIGGIVSFTFAVLVISAALALSRRRAVMAVVWILAAPAIIADGAHLAFGRGWLDVTKSSIMILFLGLTIVLLIRYLFETRRVTFNTICASLCAYMLLAVMWASVYSLVDLIEPGSFSMSFIEDPAQQRMRLGGQHSVYPLYFSVVTMTTLGYGDITPATTATRLLAATQALLGQIYLVVLVARLVGLHISHSEAERLAAD